MNLGELFLQASLAEFERYKSLSEKALAQLSVAEWFYLPAPESNCAAHLVKHMGGNLRSRWTDFLSSDGEKPNRNRDGEFELDAADNPQTLQALWDEGWQAVLGTLQSLTTSDLERSVTIRSQPHSVVEAIQRSLAHAAYHSGQLVQLAKQIRGADFQNLSVPKGQSQQFLEAMQAQARAK